MREKVSAFAFRIGQSLFALLFVWHFTLVLLLGASRADPARGLVYEIGSVYVSALAYHLRNALFFGVLASLGAWMALSPRDEELPRSGFKFSRYPLYVTALAICFAITLTSILVQVAFDFSPPSSEFARWAFSVSKMGSLFGVGGWFFFMITLIWRANKDKSASRDDDRPPNV